MSENLKRTYWHKIPFLDFYLKKILLENRLKIFKIFKNNINYNDNLSVLDVGTTADEDESHNIILNLLKKNNNITCFSNQDCQSLKKKYPHIKNFLIGDGTNNNLSRNSFDIVYSSATIEHVGSFEKQTSFISECFRVSKGQTFITTPNRYFPIDFHTKLPLVHFLPKFIHRQILKILGFKYLSFEENLNLLSKSDLINICKILNIKKYKIIEHKLWLLSSNLILIIDKQD